MIVPAQPLFFQPIYKETLWGGNALASRFNRTVLPGRPIGESWEIASVANEQSVVSTGPLSGTKLSRLISEPSETLLGKANNFGIFPLLIKFIDAKDRLSVQVHPDDLQARANGWGEFGKTECWYILDAKENARLVVGFNRNVTRVEISRAIENNTLNELLNIIPVRQGDVLHIPAGTVHAIMEGTLLYEIQETSDTTLRLYDWGRVDDAGKPRLLHVHDAMTVLDLSGNNNYRTVPVTFEENGVLHSWCAANRFFALERYTFPAEKETILPGKRSFRVLTVIRGALRLHYPRGTVKMTSGTTTLLPAVLQEVRAAGLSGTELLVTSIPDLQRELIVPLREKGVDDATIGLLGGCPGHNDLLRYLQV